MTLDPPRNVEVVATEAHMLRGTTFDTGLLFEGCERRFRVTYRVPASEDSVTELGDVTLRYTSRDGAGTLRVADITLDSKASQLPELARRDP